jgi:excisionase family DNA binding protein
MERAKVIRISRRGAWLEEQRAPMPPNSQLIIKTKKPLPEVFLTVQQVAKRLNVGIWCIYDFINSGELQCQRIGRLKRVSMEALEEFLILQNLKNRRRSPHGAAVS